MEMFTLPGLILLGAWLFVWYRLFWTGTQHNHLDIHPMLQNLTLLVVVNIVGFHFISFNAVTGIVLPFTNTTLLVSALALICLGVILFSTSRASLHHLSASDIMFGKNTQYTNSGIYTYCSHPMYLGMMSILIGSWLLFPTYIGLLILASISIILYAKKYIE